MGRGNVSVSGRYEGLFYIDNDHIHVYRRDAPLGDEPETRLMESLSSADINTGAWLYDEYGTMEEEGDILECFMDSFGRMFPASPERERIQVSQEWPVRRPLPPGHHGKWPVLYCGRR